MEAHVAAGLAHAELVLHDRHHLGGDGGVLGPADRADGEELDEAARLLGRGKAVVFVVVVVVVVVVLVLEAS